MNDRPRPAWGGISAWLRAFWRARRHAARFDADMHDEMRFHIEMEAGRLVREQGLSPDDAARRAHVMFGGVEKYKQEGRATQPLHWLDGLWLDVRLGLRMLVKHRAVTLIGSFALAVAIAIGATSFEIITEAMYAPLPIDEGERVVAIQYQTDDPGNPERRILGEFLSWRDELTSLHQLGAFHTLERNLITVDAPPEPVFVAETTASAFAVARTPPLLGRYLLSDDERIGAPDVMVIGYRVWQARFGADAQIIGRTVNLDATPYVIVGVMPDGFRFPVNHEYWIPFATDGPRNGPFEGPSVRVFARLAPGAGFDEAQAELTAIGQRWATQQPQLYERKRPVVMPYTREHAEVDSPLVAWLLWMAQLLISALVAVVGINVAILMYAQTMARRSEMAVRTALGAGRGRILTQLFLEAFALSMIGAGLGLVLAQTALEQFVAVLIDSGATFIPYWIDLDVSLSTVGYGIAMAAVAAVIVGVLPGMKVTGPGLQASLRELGGGLTVALGRTWTALIVTQVAVAVAVLPIALYMVLKVAELDGGDPGFPADRFVVADVSLNDDAEMGPRHGPLLERLRREPGVANVTFSSAVPGSSSAYRRLEFDLSTPSERGGTLNSDSLRRPVGILEVDVDLFAVYRAQLLAGRVFRPSDRAGTNAVVVDRRFVEMMMGTRPALGQRFRYTRALDDNEPGAPPSEWFEIVGVVDNIPAFPLELATEEQPTVYHLAPATGVHPLVVSVEFASAIPGDVIGRFRSAGGAVDPALQLRNIMPLTENYESARSFSRLIAGGLSLMTMSVLLLSAAGIYALLSFTVTQRTREIGIRSALGGSPGRVLAGIFGKVTTQITTGVVIGSLFASVLLAGMAMSRTEAIALLLIVPAIILAVGLVAALGPARRSLRIQTTEALRA